MNRHHNRYSTYTAAAILILSLLIYACGPESSRIELGNSAIIWQGHVYENPELYQKFMDTMQCLDGMGIRREGGPYVVMTENYLIVDGIIAQGCSTGSTVYFSAMEEKQNKTVSVFKHEIVHWATYNAPGLHGTQYFDCAAITENGT